MKSLVIYSSQTGNTRKLADAVYETLSGSKKIFTVNDAPDPSGYDFIALGFWFMSGRPDPGTLEYMSMEYFGNIRGKRLFLFATHGAAADSLSAEDGMSYAKMLTSEAKIVGTFSCQGEVNPEIIEKARTLQEVPEWVAQAPKAVGHPNDTDIEELKRVLCSAIDQS